MKKWIWALISIFIIIILCAVLISGKVMACQLFLEDDNASIEVMRNGKVIVTEDEMKLKIGDIVKVISGNAVIVFYESDILRLEEGAEIEISGLKEEDINIKQNSGNSWSRVSGLAGIKKYAVETPNTVATVRGTGFGVVVSGGESSVLVDEGKVEFSAGEQKEIISEKEKAEFRQEKIRKTALTQKDKEFIKKHLIKDVIDLKQIRDRKIAKQKALKVAVMKAKGWNETQLNDYINEADEGEHDIDEMIKESPVKLNRIEKIAELTRKIQEINSKLNPEERKEVKLKIAERLRERANNLSGAVKENAESNEITGKTVQTGAEEKNSTEQEIVKAGSKAGGEANSTEEQGCNSNEDYERTKKECENAGMTACEINITGCSNWIICMENSGLCPAKDVCIREGKCSPYSYAMDKEIKESIDVSGDKIVIENETDRNSNISVNRAINNLIDNLISK